MIQVTPVTSRSEVQIGFSVGAQSRFGRGGKETEEGRSERVQVEAVVRKMGDFFGGGEQRGLGV